MAQNPNDPKVKAYYRKQRQDAELGTLRGDPNAKATLQRIAGKLGARAGQRDRIMLQGPEYNTASPVPVQNDPVTFIPDLALGLGHALASGVGAAGRGIARAASHLFPEAPAATSRGLARALPRASGARVVRTTVEDVHPRVGSAKPKALPKKASPSTPKNVTPQKPRSFGEQARAKVRTGTAKAKQAKARAGTRAKTPIPQGGGTRPALPKPKPLGKDFKQPSVGAAGNPRITQRSQRAKGVNPRQAPNYSRKSKRAGS